MLCAQSLSCLWLFVTSLDCSPPDFSVHGVLQARVLECVAISTSRNSSRPKDRTRALVSCIAGRFFTAKSLVWIDPLLFPMTPTSLTPWIKNGTSSCELKGYQKVSSNWGTVFGHCYHQRATSAKLPSLTPSRERRLPSSPNCHNSICPLTFSKQCTECCWRLLDAALLLL